MTKETTLNTTEVFVDAYNVIRDGDVMLLAAACSYEQARELLRNECRAYLVHHPDHLLYLVFDGDSSVPCQLEKSRGQLINEKHSIREIFSETGVTADQWIIQFIKKQPPLIGSVVVTRDIDLIQSCFILGVPHVSPHEFFSECRKTIKHKKLHPNGSKKKGKPKQKSTHHRATVDDEKSLSGGKKENINREISEAFSDLLDETL